MDCTENFQLDRGLSEREACAILGVSCHTLRRMAQRGEGPKRIRISTKRVIYRASELAAYIEQRANM